MKKEDEFVYLKKVKKDTSPTKKYVTEDFDLFLLDLIKLSLELLIVIGFLCLTIISLVEVRNTVKELDVKSKTTVVETSDTAKRNNSPTDDFALWWDIYANNF